MSYFHRIKTIEDRKRFLNEILLLQTQIRVKREKARLSTNSQNEQYTKIFEPITNSIKSLKEISVAATTTNDKTHDKKNLIDFNHDLIDTPVNDDVYDTLPQQPLIPMDAETYEKEEEEGEKYRPHVSLYKTALVNVPVKSRDDGVFGLNAKTQRFGDNTYSVDGNTLKVTNDEDGFESVFVINDINVWIILLAQRPASLIQLKNKRRQYIPEVIEYVDIVNKLKLVEAVADRSMVYKNRAKYKIIKDVNEKQGSGFLFSIKPPPFLHKKLKKKNKKKITFKPSTVVIPSDKKGLMRALLKALAELRAGNTSMRNLVVPLAQEAKRKRLLPVNLLSPDEETWVFA